MRRMHVSYGLSGIALSLAVALSGCGGDNQDSSEVSESPPKVTTISGTLQVTGLDISADPDEGEELQEDGTPCVDGPSSDTIVTVTDSTDQTIAKTTLGEGATEVTTRWTAEELNDQDLPSSWEGQPVFGNCKFSFAFDAPSDSKFLTVAVDGYGQVPMQQSEIESGQVSLSVSGRS